MNQWRSQWQQIIVIAIVIFFGVIILNNPVGSQADSTSKLPTARVHSLPPFLANWQDPTNSGDYFEQIESTPLGYLVWSQFPVRVYVEQSTSTENTAANRRFSAVDGSSKRSDRPMAGLFSPTRSSTRNGRYSSIAIAARKRDKIKSRYRFYMIYLERLQPKLTTSFI